MLDAVFLSRLQFAFTIGFHYLFPPVTIGMSWLIVWFLGRYLKSGDQLYYKIAKFWIKIFAITFAMGVATGITMEFQFGTNWAHYSRFVGDIFGAPLAAEGIFAFFLESSFFAILLYGAKRVTKRMYWFSALMVAVGATLSAFWIIVANSWQQTPAGFKIINNRAELVDFFAAVFNPSTIPRYLHTIDGALITGSFFIAGISAYFILKGRHLDFAKKSLQVSLIFVAISSFMALPLGHYHAVQVANTQPAKLAAFEGLWESGDRADLLLFGIPDEKMERTDWAVGIPGGLSLLVGGSLDTYVRGLKDFPKDERPPLKTTFFSFHLMVALGMFFIALSAWGLWLLYRNKLFDCRLFLRILFFTIPLPFIANELGWVAAEVGRQPWIVQGLLRTRDAISVSVSAVDVLISLIIFALIYAFIFWAWIYLLRMKISKGPTEV